MNAFFLLAAAAAAAPVDTTYEGKWFVSDTTNNNTGEREVYAFQIHLKPNDPDYVTLMMRCKSGKPTFSVEWDGIAFPNEAVLTIGSTVNSDAEPIAKSYVFQKAKEANAPGLIASPETSASIVAHLGNSIYATVTAHTPAGSRTVGVEVDGTQRAWRRVSRHCPVQMMPRPQL